jgi:serine/threonine protein kinase
MEGSTPVQVRIAARDLEYGQPEALLGHGASCEVLRATYHGTAVTGALLAHICTSFSLCLSVSLSLSLPPLFIYFSIVLSISFWPFSTYVWPHQVAVKRFIGVAADAALTLEREVLLLTTLRHPNVVQCLGSVMEQSQRPCIVLELMEGGFTMQVRDRVPSVGAITFVLFMLFFVISGFFSSGCSCLSD